MRFDFWKRTDRLSPRGLTVGRRARYGARRAAPSPLGEGRVRYVRTQIDVFDGKIEAFEATSNGVRASQQIPTCTAAEATVIGNAGDYYHDCLQGELGPHHGPQRG